MHRDLRSVAALPRELATMSSTVVALSSSSTEWA
jgi:hypothetical protein